MRPFLPSKRHPPFGKLCCSTCTAERFVYIVLSGALVCVCLSRNDPPPPLHILPGHRNVWNDEWIGKVGPRVCENGRNTQKHCLSRRTLDSVFVELSRGLDACLAVRFRSRWWWFGVTLPYSWITFWGVCYYRCFNGVLLVKPFHESLNRTGV